MTAILVFERLWSLFFAGLVYFGFHRIYALRFTKFTQIGNFQEIVVNSSFLAKKLQSLGELITSYRKEVYRRRSGSHAKSRFENQRASIAFDSQK